MVPATHLRFQLARNAMCDWIGLASCLAAVAFLGGCGAGSAVRVDAVNVRLVAQDTSWHASYLIPARRGAATAVPTGREVHVPLGADVRLALTSRDFISDFTLPQLGLRDFAAPDLPSEIHFRADRPGRYVVRGDELCGRPHTDTARGWLVVEDAGSFRAWVQKRAQGKEK
jgi:cytochrome c oxidase subunit 2